ncbi:M1 family aminopeptidase, partial [Algoriphagus sp.]|uniref:M1 family aminopeptidase n=1 Tax=Algoriphagus sp. TaxID=1872435 RepID=UPI0025E109B9
LHMLRGVVGTDNFWKGIRSYYATYQNGSASTADFRREMEEASGQNLGQFFEQWLYKPGALVLDGDWSYDAANQEVKIRLNQVQEDGSLFQMPIQVEVQYAEEKKQLDTLLVNQKGNEFRVKVEREPKEVILDPGFWVLKEASFTRNIKE